MAGRKKRQVGRPEPAEGRFPYEERAAEARLIHVALREAAEQQSRTNEEGDVRRFRATHARLVQAIESAIPPGLAEAARRFPEGDLSGLLDVLEFLEADPHFFSSGYLKAALLRRLKHAPELPDPYPERLRRLLIARVEGRTSREEFRAYCRIAVRIATPEFVEALRERLDALQYSYVAAGKAERMLALLDPTVSGQIGKPLPMRAPAR